MNQQRRPRSNSANATPKALTEFKTPEGTYELRGGKLYSCAVAQKGRSSMMSSASSPPSYHFAKNNTNSCPSKLALLIPKAKAINQYDAPVNPTLLALNFREGLRTYPFPPADFDFATNDLAPLQEPDYPIAVQSHNFNPLGRGNYARLVTLVSGDILVREYDGKTHKSSSKELRFNAQKYINGVLHVAWLPQSDNLFAVSSSDGRLYFLDKTLVEPSKDSVQWEKDPTDTRSFSIYQPIREGINPVSYWEISKKAITGFNFAPNGEYLATVGKDGVLRIFNIDEKMLVAAFRSYYGAFLCVEWSADSKFVLTGGEDDLVSIFDPFVKKKLIARGMGHQSWITQVGFDPYHKDKSGHTVDNLYRFASVAEDGLFMMWEYLVENNDNDAEVEEVLPVEDSAGIIPAASRDAEDVVTLEPVVSYHLLHTRPLTDLHFLPDALVTASSGFAKIWDRPQPKVDVTCKSEEAKEEDKEK